MTMGYVIWTSRMEPKDLIIAIAENSVVFQTGPLKRQIDLIQNRPTTTGVWLNTTNLTKLHAPEFTCRVARSFPNQRPPSLNDQTGAKIAGIVQDNHDKQGTDGLNVKQNTHNNEKTFEMAGAVRWGEEIHFGEDPFPSNYGCQIQIDPLQESNGLHVQHAQILCQPPASLRSNVSDPILASLDGLVFVVHYRVLAEFPVIEKWLEIRNMGTHWLRIDQVRLERLEFNSTFHTKTLLTPEERGSQPSILGISNKAKSDGVILLSEVPSALRLMYPVGTMGYVNAHFEWVLGPNEAFVSERVWHYAFTGQNLHTPTGLATVLDRTVEGPFQTFLIRHLKIVAYETPLPGPVWCTWSNLAANINDTTIREQADLAAQIGFKTFQIDAGWAESADPSDWTAGGGVPNPTKFPQFQETCEYIRSKGMDLGLWMSCYRPLDSKDMREMPAGRSLPWIKRGKCVGMSFASPWRDYYVKDVLHAASTYGASYFKQDLTNIKYGDIADGHEGRTLKDSILRGLRGFLSAQASIHHQNALIWTMVSHELYWGTPGVPCDIAALRSVCGYHIPPNDYSGCGKNRQRWQPSWTSKHGDVGRALKRGCLHARDRYYAMRGLPLYCLEYYGAATVNIQGSLTPAIQDRQICSWLMGMPSVYAGDLCSLTSGNIRHYHRRFQLLHTLQQKYDIYHHFQYSGAPVPTDWGWHWWGKINPHGEGLVVVLRGRWGTKTHFIHIPWVDATKNYFVWGCFQEKAFGTFTGKELQQGHCKIALPRWGQEILEIRQAP